MMEKCIEMNVINFDAIMSLISKGSVEAIYIYLEDGENVIVLNCEQNESKLRILLLVKVAGNKVSEMNYNIVKQEYYK